MSDKKAIIEGLKELARTALMAIVPLLILELQRDSGKINWTAIAVAGAIAVLSGIDKMLHKKEVGVGGNGLTGI